MEDPIVEIQFGQIKGLKGKSALGDDFYSFLGIPYAAPPIGNLRFRDPEPVEKWSGIKDCTKFGPVCAQMDLFFRTFQGTEDCLYLNVYTKSYKADAKQPVMFWIHGGGFVAGSGNNDIHGPDYLLQKNIVLVTFNYRLNIFGFLNLENEVASGNQGLKDQVQALHWVNNNIAKFGGDPSNITIFGGSAGAISVHLLTLSPLTKGLFHKAICQSGVANAAWGNIEHPKEYAIRLAKFLGHDSTEPASIVDFFRSLPCKTLVEALPKIKTPEERASYIFHFGPGVDETSKKPFLPVPVDEIITQGIHVPLLLGYNSREGIFALPDPNNSQPIETAVMGGFTVEYFENINKDLKSHMPVKVLRAINKYGLDTADVKYMYFKNKPISKESEGIYADLITDLYIVMPIHEVAKIQVQKNCPPTFMYIFSYDKGPSFVKKTLNTFLPGAAHLDEISYLFYSNYTEKFFPKKDSDIKVMKHMVEMWTNFARFGNPVSQNNVNWKQLKNGKSLNVLNIGEYVQMDMISNIEERFSSAEWM